MNARAALDRAMAAELSPRTSLLSSENFSTNLRPARSVQEPANIALPRQNRALTSAGRDDILHHSLAATGTWWL